MQENQGNKRKWLIYFFLAVLFILLSYICFELLTSRNSASKTARVQSVLHEKEQQLDRITDRVRQNILSAESDSSYFLNPAFNQTIPKGCALLVYQDSVLKYWSDNRAIPSDSLVYLDFTTRFSFISNGWYVIKKHPVQDKILLSLIRVKNKYPFENNFIKNEFQEDFGIAAETSIQSFPLEFNIFSNDHTFLFSLEYPKHNKITETSHLLLILLFFAGFLSLLISLFHAYWFLSKYKLPEWLIISGFIFDAVLLRFLIYYFEIPRFIHNTQLFNPSLFASSPINDSLGDLILNSITILVIVFFLYKKLDIYERLAKFQFLKKYILPGAILILTYLLLIGLDSLLTDLIVNSTLSFDLYNITTLNKYSIIGLLCFGLLILSFVLLTYNPLKSSLRFLNSDRGIVVWLSEGLAFSILFCLLFFSDKYYLILFYGLYLLAFVVIFRKPDSYSLISKAALFVLLFSFFSTFIVHRTNKKNERDRRTVFAHKLSSERDFAAEYLFNQIVFSVERDSVIFKLLDSYFSIDENNPERIVNYLRPKYFSGYWSRYDVLITICDSSKVLNIQPEDVTMDCFQYFNNIVSEKGSATVSKNLFYIDSDFSFDNYLGIINLPHPASEVKIFIEIFSRLVPRGLGYPELLNDHKEQTYPASRYSWAIYKNNTLNFHFGKYSYPLSLSVDFPAESQVTFFNLNGSNHLFFPAGKNTILIVSKKNPGWIDTIAPFSYFVLFYGFLLTLFWLVFAGLKINQIIEFNIKRKLQFFIVALTVISFLFVGISSMVYIISRNNSKNQDVLSEKAHSVLIELEHKLAGEEELTSEIGQYMSDLLYKFSMVFFTDINIYNTEGSLLATSRPEIFSKGLNSTQMNPEAYQVMSIKQSSAFIHDESIGEYKYLSAYLPFRNEQNKLTAFLNLPYFAKQEELTSDISTFLVTLINIYVIMIALAVFIALVVTRYVTKPVALIKEKISRLKLGKTNEKIEWEKKDEIGSLVNEYNRMVEELARSAEMLAKSERESAWREMAQQIAHEIKNPLTPMKLSVQYLQKAWEDKSDDWELRLKRFSQTIIEQIESLSTIASEFSDFAKMPRSNFSITDLNSVVEHSINLFQFSTTVRFNFTSAGNPLVYADKEQLQRVFINLINNSIQAIPAHSQGSIEISINTEDRHHIIRFTDNGKGIPKEERSRVFYPNFTTKTGGMGLGLAMVKSIIQNTRGEITFDSEEGKGTTFIIILPAYRED